MNRSFRVLIHGGAGVISRDNLNATLYIDKLQNIVKSIQEYIVREENVTALDVAEFGVMLLEDEILFNAGRGSVYAANGKHEMEASIMNGSDLRCGAVSLVSVVRNPISLARKIMEQTPHNYLIGEEALNLARKNNMEIVENSFFDSENRYEQLQQAKQRAQVILDHSSDAKSDSDMENKTGTVGCVCMLDGNIAAATSTGGMTNKLSGRIGDTPIIGAGTYADNTTCAVSCTGVGEEFMRHVAAYDISARIRYGKVSLVEAAKGTVFEKLPDNTGGVIAVDTTGNYAFEFNSPGMFRGMCASDGTALVGIWKEEIHFAI